MTDWQTALAQACKGLAQLSAAINELTAQRVATTAEIAKYSRRFANDDPDR